MLQYDSADRGQLTACWLEWSSCQSRGVESTWKRVKKVGLNGCLPLDEVRRVFLLGSKYKSQGTLRGRKGEAEGFNERRSCRRQTARRRKGEGELI
jgi:hypothetical protein